MTRQVCYRPSRCRSCLRTAVCAPPGPSRLSLVGHWLFLSWCLGRNRSRSSMVFGQSFFRSRDSNGQPTPSSGLAHGAWLPHRRKRSVGPANRRQTGCPCRGQPSRDGKRLLSQEYWSPPARSRTIPQQHFFGRRVEHHSSVSKASVARMGRAWL